MQIQIQPQQGTINYPHYFCRATASMHIVQIITMIQTNMRTLRHTIHHLTRSRLYVGIMPSSLHHWPVTQIQPLHISTILFILPQTKGCTRPIQLCGAMFSRCTVMRNTHHQILCPSSQVLKWTADVWICALYRLSTLLMCAVCSVMPRRESDPRRKTGPIWIPPRSTTL